jgi:3-oxoacyl-[acyl-carrier protein] reductase
MTRFDSISLGDIAEVKHTVTQGDIEKFATLTGDDNKLHVNAEFAARTSFKKPVAHGMLGASFISTVIGTKLPGDGALWFKQSLEFHLPVFVGDTLVVTAEVVKKIPSSQILELRTDIVNQARQKVTSGVAQVRMIVPEEPATEDMQAVESKRVALILGGSGGIGRATSMALADKGFDVVIHYLSNKKMAERIRGQIEDSGGKAIVLRADITDESCLKEFIFKVKRQFGTITTLVNCTTISIPQVKFESLEWTDIQKHIDINVRASFNIIKEVLPIMKENRYGNIINVSTKFVDSTPPSKLLPYVTAKAALEGFSRALAVELAPVGIRVNLVSPGMTDTELVASVPEKTRLTTAARTPMRRLAKPEDVAGAIAFLASEDASYLSGETIRVNGGQVML